LSFYRRTLAFLLLSCLILQLSPFPSAYADDEAVPNGSGDRQLVWNKLFKEPTDADYHTDDYAYGNGIYVSTYGGYTSKDGVHWTSNPKLKQDNIYFTDLVWGKGRFVAIGHDDDEIPVWTSTDGVNWTETARLKAHTATPRIAFSGVRFVVAGGHNAKGYIFSSEDGLKWTERATGMTTDLKGLAWGNNIFVALGYQGGTFLVSKDGIAWRKVSIPAVKNASMWTLSFDKTFNGDMFIATGDGIGRTVTIASKDGVKWTSLPQENGITWTYFKRVKDLYIATGSKKTNGKETWIYRTSKDGVHWSDVKYKGADFSLFDAVHDGKQYVAYTPTAVFASTDGVNWKTIKTIPLKPDRLLRSAVGNGKLVSVGGSLDYFDPDIEDKDTRSFFRMDSSGKIGYSREQGKYPLFDVIWTGSQFYAVGYNGLVMTSPDGSKWTKAASPTKETITRIIQAGGTYYITGSNGLIMASKDLKTWTRKTMNVDGYMNSIAWNGKTFVAVGDRGLVLVSNDGTTWKAVKGNSKFDYNDVAWGNGTFVIAAAQNYNGADSYTVLKSADGTSWKEITLRFDEKGSLFPKLYGVHYDGNAFVAVGNNGVAYLSSNGEKCSKQRSLDGNALFSAQSFNGRLYVVGFTDQVYVADLSAP